MGLSLMLRIVNHKTILTLDLIPMVDDLLMVEPILTDHIHMVDPMPVVDHIYMVDPMPMVDPIHIVDLYQ